MSDLNRMVKSLRVLLIANLVVFAMTVVSVVFAAPGWYEEKEPGKIKTCLADMKVPERDVITLATISEDIQRLSVKIDCIEDNLKEHDIKTTKSNADIEENVIQWSMLLYNNDEQTQDRVDRFLTEFEKQAEKEKFSSDLVNLVKVLAPLLM